MTTPATPTTIAHLGADRWLVTRHGLASYHPTLASACAEAGWAGDLPAQPVHRPTTPAGHTVYLLHRPGSLTHPWAVSCPALASQVDHTDLASALGALATAVEAGHRPHIGPYGQAEIRDETGHGIDSSPSLAALRALAAIARPNPLDSAAHAPNGIPADLAHPIKPQEPTP